MSNEIKRCEGCQGRKQIMGMGWMIKDCPKCKGIGWVAKEPEDAPSKDIQSYDVIEEKLENGEENSAAKIAPKRTRKLKR